jgi:6-phosphofructokinase 1
MSWESVNGWTPKGGALLGTKRTLADGKLPDIAEQITKHNLQGLLIIGGFEVRLG